MKMRNILVALLALCMVFVLCACGEVATTDGAVNNQTTAPAQTTPATTTPNAEATEPSDSGSDNVDYTVTVVDSRGNPVAGAKIQLCVGDQCLLPQTTDENGVVVFNQPVNDYKIGINKLPDGYTSEVTEFYFGGDNREKTITVNLQTLDYTVTVLDQDGAVANVPVKFSSESGDNTYVTNEEGKIVVKNVKTDYVVSIETMPEGYAEDTTEYTFAEGTSELTITLKPAA